MQYTPLSGEYERHGGKVVDFHGWGLPVQFRGILEEHRWVRQQAGVFDCSHMAEFVIRGADNIRSFSNLVIGDLTNLAVGRCRYTALLNASGGILDDGVALRLSPEELFLVTNAGTHDAVSAWLQRHIPEIEDISGDMAKIDVQGPRALQTLLKLGFAGMETMSFWAGRRCQWQGMDMVVTRAGYTGELGYELFVPNNGAVALWRALMALPEIMPCGLGARDTLRTEMGYPLSGQDVDETRTPVEAGLNRFIAWDTEFPGKPVLEKQRESGAHDTLVALRSMDKRAPRHGFELRHDGGVVGVVTSGTFGPSVGYGIGLGYVPAALARPGLQLEAGPRALPVVIETLPFYKQATGRNPIEISNPKQGGDANV